MLSKSWRVPATALMLSLAAGLAQAASSAPVTIDLQAAGPSDLSLVNADLFFDKGDAPVVQIATGLLADDIQRVAGHRPTVKTDAHSLGRQAVLIGTLGESPVIDKLAADGKIDVSAVRDRPETFGWFMVEKPLPGVARALVIAGADRRGTAYGATEISRQIGVSPWYWWADVSPAKHAHLRVTGQQSVEAPPTVRYRGIFINDEDFGLRPWAYKTDDPGAKRFGPKTYAKVFELMLRLRLNFLWPAMHPGSGEFTSVPGNAELADQWAIVTGASHCEPMLRNNVYWPKDKGEWRYDTNRQNIFDYWKWAAINRGPFESVWTLGIRGIHDTGMSGPKEMPARVAMMEQIFADQQQLINADVTRKYGPPAECFVPYKEVLPLYENGLKVPDNVTIVWPDDNFGYIRRLATPAERKRSGGTGVYYHISYWGGPHSYLWLESTSPGQIWEEMHKAYENGTQRLWILNVGDIKPGEIAVDFWSKLAWNPDAYGPDAQRVFLDQFCNRTFGTTAGPKVHALLDHYYALAAHRRPEHLSYANPEALAPAYRESLLKAYDALMAEEQAVAAVVPQDRQDTYFETVGYAAQAFGAAGRLFMGDPADQPKWKQRIDNATTRYNDSIAGGKWKYMMALNSTDVRWPEAVGGKMKPFGPAQPAADDPRPVIDAASGRASSGARSWQAVDGVGWSGHAITPLPTTADTAKEPCTISYDFTLPQAGEATIQLDVLPTIRLSADYGLRVGVAVDEGSVKTVDVPGGDVTNERDKARSTGVVTGRTPIEVQLGQLSAGKHTLKIVAVDPGVVLDQIHLPAGATVK